MPDPACRFCQKEHDPDSLCKDGQEMVRSVERFLLAKRAKEILREFRPTPTLPAVQAALSRIARGQGRLKQPALLEEIRRALLADLKENDPEQYERVTGVAKKRAEEKAEKERSAKREPDWWPTCLYCDGNHDPAIACYEKRGVIAVLRQASASGNPVRRGILIRQGADVFGPIRVRAALEELSDPRRRWAVLRQIGMDTDLPPEQLERIRAAFWEPEPVEEDLAGEMAERMRSMADTLALARVGVITSQEARSSEPLQITVTAKDTAAKPLRKAKAKLAATKPEAKPERQRRGRRQFEADFTEMPEQRMRRAGRSIDGES